MTSIVRAWLVAVTLLGSIAVHAEPAAKGVGGYVIGRESHPLPGGKTLTLDNKGSAQLGDDFLFVTVSDLTVFGYAYEVVGDDLYVMVAVRYTAPGAGVLGPSLFIAKASLAKGKATWTTNLHAAFQSRGSEEWSYLLGKGQLFIRQHERVAAFDAATGKLKWTVRAVDAAFNEHYGTGLEAKAQNVLYYDKIELAGDRLVATGKRYAMNEPFTLELDAATGQRVHVQTKYVPPKVRPLFDYQNHMQPPVRDGPLPSPPPKPEAWDGLFIGLCTLVWNTHTGEGVIWNPTARDRDVIVDAAKRVRYADAAGKPQPVRWLLVVDSLQLVLGKAGMPAPAGLKKYPDALKKDTVRIEYRIDLLQTGDHIDATAVAAALGAKAVIDQIETPVKTDAGPLSPVRQKGASGTLLFFWGPLLITTDDQRSSLYTTSSI